MFALPNSLTRLEASGTEEFRFKTKQSWGWGQRRRLDLDLAGQGESVRVTYISAFALLCKEAKST